MQCATGAQPPIPTSFGGLNRANLVSGHAKAGSSGHFDVYFQRLSERRPDLRGLGAGDVPHIGKNGPDLASAEPKTASEFGHLQIAAGAKAATVTANMLGPKRTNTLGPSRATAC